MAKPNDKLLGIFELQAQAFVKIEELKEEGYLEEDMHVFAKNKNSIDVLVDKTRVNYSTGETGDWKGKYQSVFSSDDTNRGAYTDIGESHNGTTDYNQHIEEGKVILYVDSRGDGRSEGQVSGGTLSDSRARRGSSDSSEESIRLREQQLNIEKEQVQTGAVNVEKHLIEEEKKIEVPVEREEVYVERRPVNEEVTAKNQRANASGDKDIHIPVTEEQLNVSKDEVVSEEVVVGKKKVKGTEEVNETVRREEADIDEIPAKRKTDS